MQTTMHGTHLQAKAFHQVEAKRLYDSVAQMTNDKTYGDGHPVSHVIKFGKENISITY